MEELFRADQQLFERINSGLANPFLDWLMPLFRNPFVWAPVYVFFAAFFIYNFKPKGLYIVLFGLFTLALSDQISASFLKPLVHRLRPCAEPSLFDHIRLLIPCGAGYSFPSSHATNHFAFSVFLISVMPSRMRWVVPFALVWAAGIAFAQIYVGIHYPIDVTFGAILGCFIGYFTGHLCKSTLRLNLDRTPDEDVIIENEPE